MQYYCRSNPGANVLFRRICTTKAGEGYKDPNIVGQYLDLEVDTVSRSLLKVVNQSCQLWLSLERATNHLIQPSGDARSNSAACLAQKVL